MIIDKGLTGKARIPTDVLFSTIGHYSHNHSMAFQIPSASIEAYNCGFFPHSYPVLNDLSLISPDVMSDCCVSKFALVVHLVSNFSPSRTPW